MLLTATEIPLIALHRLSLAAWMFYAGPAMAVHDPAGLWTIHERARVISIDEAARVCTENGAYQYRLPEPQEVNYKLLKQLAKVIDLPAPVWILAGQPGEAALAVEIYSGQRRNLAAGGNISPGVFLCRCAVSDSEFGSSTETRHYGRSVWIKPTPIGSVPEAAPAEWINRNGDTLFTDLASEAPFAEAQAMCREIGAQLLTMAEIRSTESASQGSDWHRRISDGSCFIWTKDRSTRESNLKWAFRFADQMATFLHSNGIGRVICRRSLTAAKAN
jgi:hypothetical protein